MKEIPDDLLAAYLSALGKTPNGPTAGALRDVFRKAYSEGHADGYDNGYDDAGELSGVAPGRNKT